MHTSLMPAWDAQNMLGKACALVLVLAIADSVRSLPVRETRRAVEVWALLTAAALVSLVDKFLQISDRS